MVAYLKVNISGKCNVHREIYRWKNTDNSGNFINATAPRNNIHHKI